MQIALRDEWLNKTKVGLLKAYYKNKETDMRIYRVSIIADRYPTDYNVEASNWGTAVSRAIKEWQKRFKGCRADQLRIRAIKSSTLLKAENGNEDSK